MNTTGENMKRQTSRNLGLSVMLVLVVLLGSAAAQRRSAKRGRPAGLAPAPAPVLLAGQSSTLLPDGRWLVVGGIGASGPQARVAVGEAGVEAGKALSARLERPRGWHTATVLPTGSVLIFGGLDAGGVVDVAELFDPVEERVQTISSSALSPRSYHAATLLTDGRVLITGGVSKDGRMLATVELWNPRTGTVEAAAASLSAARRNHTATLLPDGRVLVAGGLGEDGRELRSAEIYDLTSQSVVPVDGPSPQDVGDTLSLEASLPADGSADVPLDTWLALRFSRPLRVTTVNQATVTLSEGDRPVAAKVVSAEGGRLAFVAPEMPLLPGAAYVLRLDNLSDPSGAPLPMSEIRFTTASEANRASDSHPPPVKAKSKDDPDDLPPLQAPPGVTALSGRVLTLNGKGLAGVTLETICGKEEREAESDGTGRFLITPIPSGHCKLEIDGTTANRQGKSYGLYLAGVDIVAGKTSVLPYVIWMTEIDWPHAVRVPSPTTSEFVVTTPLLQGLELRLAPGTVIRDYDGNVVSEVSITPIPTGRPPFPLPAGVSVPFYFTIQPGGAYLSVGARLIYPNVNRAPAGAKFNFWNYDPEGKGWYIYGRGTVTPERRIDPDPGVTLYGFTGAMVASPGWAPPFGPAASCGPPCMGLDPVDLGTGLFAHQETDLVLPDVIPIQLTRTYRQADSVSRAFGIGTTHPYDLFLVGDAVTYQFTDLILPDGGRVHYVRTSPGTSYSGAVYEHTSTPSRFYKSQVRWVVYPSYDPNFVGFELTLKDGTVFSFPPADGVQLLGQAALVGMRDRYGNKLTLKRDSKGNLTRITSPSGRWIDFNSDSNNRIMQAQDNSGRTFSYEYDFGGRLVTVTDPLGGITRYTYDANNQMLTLQNPRGIVFLTNEYDAAGRVWKQTFADNTFYQVAYTVDSTGNVTQVDVTDPRGKVTRASFAPSGYYSGGYSASNTYALGLPEQQVFTYQRQAGTNFLVSVTDALNRQTAYVYDACGNTTAVTRLAGTPEAVTTNFTYQTGATCLSTFNQLTSITDPLNHTTQLGRDSNGNLTAITEPAPLNNTTTISYNAVGQRTSVTFPSLPPIQLGYASGVLSSATDALGNTTQRVTDSAGRPVAGTLPLGQTTRYQHDALSQLVQVTDPLNAVTYLSYDPNGNMLNVTDARGGGGVTTYTYDNRSRLSSRTDPLLHVESYQHDARGNLTQFTDRRNQTTNYAYDGLNRLTQVTFADQLTISYTWDAGDRLTQIVDSIAGVISRTYDDLDRLLSETTPQCTLSYTYDAAGRRTTMSVSGQQTTFYGYDNANRLTQITQGTSSVSLTYDAAGRRTSLTLPNGVLASYGYDAASRLTSITWTKGSTTLGNLTYSYDANGRRTQMGGSLARVNLPAAVASAIYNTANQLTQWGTTTLTYDLNGNLTSDGVNTYAWDARNQLNSISGTVPASFQYDALGRRIRNAAGTSFLYDRTNIVQELSGQTVIANLLTGLDIDQVFSRTDPGGTWSLLADGLGSALALTDSAGTAQAQYTYEPFGKTAASGPVSSNPFQYTRRENDGITPLYYYRARYYHPGLQRFISEDPIGFSGGDVNLYAYVLGNPVSYTDPVGLQWYIFRGPIVFGDGGKYFRPPNQRYTGPRGGGLPRYPYDYTKPGPPPIQDLTNDPVNNPAPNPVPDPPNFGPDSPTLVDDGGNGWVPMPPIDTPFGVVPPVWPPCSTSRNPDKPCVT